jgi:hypothetical protein
MKDSKVIVALNALEALHPQPDEELMPPDDVAERRC